MCRLTSLDVSISGGIWKSLRFANPKSFGSLGQNLERVFQFARLCQLCRQPTILSVRTLQEDKRKLTPQPDPNRHAPDMKWEVSIDLGHSNFVTK